jgi:hypothetical protein
VVQYVILLPRCFSDGRPVPPRLFALTYRELAEQFAGATIDTIQVIGRWRYQGVPYQDRLRRVTVTGEDTPENDAFIRSYKQTLKERFDQIDIWITAQRIEVI